jgi:putative ABC transport system permease protein
MYTVELLKISLRALRANKLRSFLTTLGIIIGISAVIAMVSIGQGAQSVIMEQIQGLGSNTVTIIPVANIASARTNQSSLQGLALNRLDRHILSLFNEVNFPEVGAITAEINSSRDISYRNRTETSAVYGVDAAYFRVRDIEIATGRALNNADNDRSRDVTVLGPGIAAELFGESDPIGKSVKIGTKSYKVVGVAVEKGSSFDSRVVVPLSNAGTELFGDRDYTQIILQVPDETKIDAVATKVEQVLTRYYRETDKENAPFTVYTSKEFLSLAETVTGVFTTLLVSIAGISLVVGGIGIMNIMLVSVTERTREIGLRKAVGAKQSAILGQFLLEAVVLTLLGGAIGIAFGIGFAMLVSRVGNIPVEVSWQSILLATSVSGLIGVIFGFYPAYRAARLNPIEALRYE